MNILILFSVAIGVALASHGDIRDCDHGHGVTAGREELQDIYQRPSAYDSADYTPHTSYGPPDPRPLPRRNYQDSSERENNPRVTYAQALSYNEIRPAPVYGPPPPRPRVAAAAGIYDEEYEDILYAQPALPPPSPVLRRYNVNYAQREPYYPRYDPYVLRRPEYRVPVYYAPLIPHGFIPVHSSSHSPTPGPTDKPTTIESVTRSQSNPESNPSYHSEHHQHTSSSEQENYDDEGQVRRQQPTVVVTNPSPVQSEIKRHLFRKPFLGLRNLFRGSILAKRNKIGLIPTIVQGSTSNL